MRTCGIFIDRNHQAIAWGQTVDILWTENSGDEPGFAIFPHGGPVKSEVAMLPSGDGKTFYFNVPESSVKKNSR